MVNCLELSAIANTGCSMRAIGLPPFIQINLDFPNEFSRCFLRRHLSIRVFLISESSMLHVAILTPTQGLLVLTTSSSQQVPGFRGRWRGKYSNHSAELAVSSSEHGRQRPSSAQMETQTEVISSSNPSPIILWKVVEQNQAKLLFSNMFICNSFTWCVTEINGKFLKILLFC